MIRSLRTPAHRALMRALVGVRRGLGLTQQEVADRLNRPQSYIAKLEVGERRLDAVELVEFCEALDVEPMVILDPMRKALRSGGG